MTAACTVSPSSWSGQAGQESQDSSERTDAMVATNTQHRRWWLFTGLGTRGLLYHAMMAEMLVDAIRADDETLLLPVLRRWKNAGGLDVGTL